MTVRSSPQGRDILSTWYLGSLPDQLKTSFSYRWNDLSVGSDKAAEWKLLVATHKDATNSFTGSKSFIDFVPTVGWGILETVFGPSRPDLWHQKFGSAGIPYTSNIRNWLPLNLPLTTVHSATALGKAVGSFNEKLLGLRTQFVGTTFLGELGESIRMIKQRTKLLKLDVETVKRKLKEYFRRNGKSRILTKDSADLWLEYSFGWLPLMNDIRSAVANLQPEPKYRVIVGTGEDISGGTLSFLENVGLDSHSKLRCDTFVSDKTVSQAKCVAEVAVELLGLTEVQGLYFRNGPEQWGLSLRDFVPTAWELLPYSFLIDYFTNVGDVVAAPWSERSALTWQFQVQRATRILNVRFSNFRALSDSWEWYVQTGFSPGSLKVGTKVITRTSPVTLIPPFFVQCPEMGNLRWANMLALWISKTLHN